MAQRLDGREVGLRAGDALLCDVRGGLRDRGQVPRNRRGRGTGARGGPGHRLRGDRRARSSQIEAIRDAVELPYVHAELFAEHDLRAPKGILLYGPPRLRQDADRQGGWRTRWPRRSPSSTGRRGGAESYFLNIKGPELLNKYVGETERHIRLVFQRAREKASEGMPVIVFFDEMDSLFRTRGTVRVRSDVENTIVPQLLSEIDGVESLENVIVIGASNREDMIDPAILRPGRLDVKIKIERPDAEAAREILSKYLVPGLPAARATIVAEQSAATRSLDLLGP